MVATPPVSAPLVLYDGLCGFCDASVRWILDHDPDGVFRFAPLQGEAAAAILARHPELPGGVDSLLVVETVGGREEVRWFSASVIAICAHLPAPWRWGRHLAWIPRPIRDVAYRAFARARYLVWGRRDTCRLPTPAERARLLP